MSYSIKPVTHHAVINDDTGQPIAVCKDRREAVAIVNAMAGHGQIGTPYAFAEWARKH